jgi:hypothetical protein
MIYVIEIKLISRFSRNQHLFMLTRNKGHLTLTNHYEQIIIELYIFSIGQKEEKKNFLNIHFKFLNLMALVID